MGNQIYQIERLIERTRNIYLLPINWFQLPFSLHGKWLL